MVKLAQSFLSGGPNFSLPLSKSLCTVNESRIKQSDVVFITDGEDRLRDSFLEEFNKKKKEKAFIGWNSFLINLSRLKNLKTREVMLHLKYKQGLPQSQFRL